MNIFTRFFNSIFGAIFGIILVIVAVAGLYYNDARPNSMHTAQESIEISASDNFADFDKKFVSILDKVKNQTEFGDDLFFCDPVQVFWRFKEK